ncbi:hypothetical protein FA15DRAFT_658715 [Coprinopsis marcescibilis]|uniref:Uncharacterized protein n=1 Tax=Coprinopsis marcescibilis TaxID=230819 RepID=A0A5C3KLQ6_COPMA|nr:hypothetical protein FA15DRAFT_658715 [Coprinopsis marcescibilis]
MERSKGRQPKDKEIIAWADSTEKARKELCDPLRAISPRGKPIVSPAYKAQASPRSSPALANQGVLLTPDAVIISGEYKTITMVGHDGRSVTITGSPSRTTKALASGRLRRNNSQGSPRAVAPRNKPQSVGTSTVRPATPLPKFNAPLDAALVGCNVSPDTDTGSVRPVPIQGSPQPSESLPAYSPIRQAKPLVTSALPAHLRLPQIDTENFDALASEYNRLPSVASDSICSADLPVPRRWPASAESWSIRSARRPSGGIFTHTPTELDFHDLPQDSADASLDSPRHTNRIESTYSDPFRTPVGYWSTHSGLQPDSASSSHAFPTPTAPSTNVRVPSGVPESMSRLAEMKRLRERIPLPPIPTEDDLGTTINPLDKQCMGTCQSHPKLSRER